VFFFYPQESPGWLKMLFNWNRPGIQYFDQYDLIYIADTFIKELTRKRVTSTAGNSCLGRIRPAMAPSPKPER
jgi:hypothetical protein